MSKTLLYRFFGIGRIPRDALDQIEREGVVLQEEGIGGSITFLKFRAPGRYNGWKRKWFSGSIVLTREHFLAFSFSKPLIGVAWNHEKLGALNCSVPSENKLLVEFDASTFNDDWSGQIEVRFSTSLAAQFLETIEGYGGKNGRFRD